MPIHRVVLTLALVLLSGVTAATAQRGPADPLPSYLRDRGTGQPTSMFATYIRRGELLFYPFMEYYRDQDMEYSPEELGYGLDVDFRGRYRATEGLIFLGYGVTDWLAIELEAAMISATLDKSPNDPTAVPTRIEESGLGDVEGQLRLRWNRESLRRPEVFSYLEVVAPTQKSKLLIGTADWEFKFGTGVIKGFSWGTVAVRTAAEYSMEESKFEVGEYAVEYIKRLSQRWRAYLGVEGSEDEIEFITEAQWHIKDNVYVKLNNAFGITSKATDWAPEVGIMISIPLAR